MSDEKKEKVERTVAMDPVGMDEWAARIKARVHFGHPNQRALVCEGEAGCGKSEITVSTLNELGLPPVICPGLGAQQMEEFLALMKLDEDKDGNPKILQAVHENILPTEKLVKDPRYTFTNSEGNKRTVIPWIIDEIFTGNMGQMNQLRGFLTFRQSGSVKVPLEVMIFGTTNPEDVAYSSRRSVDAAIMDRVETVRVKLPFDMHQKYLQKEEEKGRFPAICRLFLRIAENRELWDKVSPRFWHQGFGCTWQELSSDKSMGDTTRMRLFEHALSDYFVQIAARGKQRGKKEKIPLTASALIARFKQYISHGEDPYYYPISANRIMSASLGEGGNKDDQLNMLTRWKSDGMQSFVGITVQDLTLLVCDNKTEVCDSQAKHIADVVNLAGSGLAVQFFRELYTNRQQTPTFEMIYHYLKNQKCAADIAEAIKKNNMMVKQLREQKVERRD